MYCPECGTKLEDISEEKDFSTFTMIRGYCSKCHFTRSKYRYKDFDLFSGLSRIHYDLDAEDEK